MCPVPPRSRLALISDQVMMPIVFFASVPVQYQGICPSVAASKELSLVLANSGVWSHCW